MATVSAIRRGDLATLRQLLAEHANLTGFRLGTDHPDGMSRSMLHLVTDWPGHFPDGAAAVTRLVAAGADVNGPLPRSAPGDPAALGSQ